MLEHSEVTENKSVRKSMKYACFYCNAIMAKY